MTLQEGVILLILLLGGWVFHARYRQDECRRRGSYVPVLMILEYDLIRTARIIYGAIIGCFANFFIFIANTAEEIATLVGRFFRH